MNFLSELSDVAGNAIGPVTIETGIPFTGATQVYPSTGEPSSAGPVAEWLLAHVVKPKLNVGGVEIEPYGDPAGTRALLTLALLALVLFLAWRFWK